MSEVKQTPTTAAVAAATTAIHQVKHFVPSDDFDYINMLVYGPFGTGKTVFAATAQQCDMTGNALYISAEGGHKSIRDFGIKVDIYRINTFKQFNKVYEFLRSHAALRDQFFALDEKAPGRADIKEKLYKLKAWLLCDDPNNAVSFDAKMKEVKANPAEPKIYQSAIIDSLTEVQKYAMYHILGIDINTISLNADIPLAKLQDWGKNSEMIRLLVRSFRDLNMHTIFTCLDQSERDETDGKVVITPSLPGKLSKEICGFLDIVGYMHVRDTEAQKGMRVLQVQPAGKFHAKSRYMALGTMIDNPTVPKIVELIQTKILTGGKK